MAPHPELTDEAEWVTVAEAARRLGMSTSWIRDHATSGDIQIVRRGRQPGVSWPSVDNWIRQCRVTHRVNDALLRATDPPRAPRGIDLLDLGAARYGWSDTDIAARLRVSIQTLGHWRKTGVPNHYLFRLRREVDPHRG